MPFYGRRDEGIPGACSLCFMLLDTSVTDIHTHFTVDMDMYLFGIGSFKLRTFDYINNDTTLYFTKI